VKPVKEMSVGELAAFISTHLKENGLEVVLSGGSCVAIYSHNQYVSADLDFIERGFSKRKKLKEALEEIGFTEENRYFKHPETELIVEFPAGPLAVGSEPVQNITIMQFTTGSLSLISPTDCVKDRLAAFFYWQDQQTLEQAVLVARAQHINLNEIENWSRREGKLKEFQKIKKLLVHEQKAKK
jgi:hypothetical protein